MFTLTETDDATTKARPLTADEIDLVAGGLQGTYTRASGSGLGLRGGDGNFTPVSYAYFLGLNNASGAVAVASPGGSFAASAAISTGNGTAYSSATAISSS